MPLWSERGLIGALLLGEKRDGGLYTQEEMEVARAAGERLIDTRASAEMARRLMTLQRQRLAESQVLDRHGREGADRPLRLTVGAACRDGLEIVIADDGVGLGTAGPRAGGSGQGLALHGTMMAISGGALTVEGVPGVATRVMLTLPSGTWGSAAGE